MDESPFRFTFLPKQLPSLCNKEFKTFLEKWYLLDRLKAWTFSFDRAFPYHLKETFVKDFFNDSNVLKSIQVMGFSGSWGMMDPPKNFDIEEVNCTTVSMGFFDKLKAEGIVRENGNICKCFDEMFEGITISDELRKMLLMEDSDNFECYSDEERSELLFRLFSHLVVGGPICQYEDNIQPYFDVTKSLYKDLVSVQKKPETNELVVVSKVYKITGKDGDGKLVYPSLEEHEQNFAYLIVNPVKRHVILLYHCWGRGLW